MRLCCCRSRSCFWAQIFVPCVVLHTTVLTCINTSIAVLAKDCVVTLVMVLSSLSLVFMCYFAVEAVRTDNFFQ